LRILEKLIDDGFNHGGDVLNMNGKPPTPAYAFSLTAPSATTG
jgi:hypothetical protein